jgi:hypothetical protein
MNEQDRKEQLAHRRDMEGAAMMSAQSALGMRNDPSRSLSNAPSAVGPMEEIINRLARLNGALADFHNGLIGLIDRTHAVGYRFLGDEPPNQTAGGAIAGDRKSADPFGHVATINFMLNEVGNKTEVLFELMNILGSKVARLETL